MMKALFLKKINSKLAGYANIKKIKTETGITVRLLGDVSRTFGIENASKNLELFLENKFEFRII